MKIELTKRTNTEGYSVNITGDLRGEMPSSIRLRDETKRPLVDTLIPIDHWEMKALAGHLESFTHYLSCVAKDAI